jgi:hypothetical protein
MFDGPEYSLDDQENEGSFALPPGWQEDELAGEFASPVEAVRAHFNEALLGSGRWTHATKADISLLWSTLVTRNTLYPGVGVTRLFNEFAIISRLNYFGELTPALVGLEEFQTSDPESPQLSFGLRGVFAPSKNLTDFWVRSVKALAHEANVREGMELASTQLELQQEFSKMLTSLFGAIGQQLRYGNNSDLNITKNGKFLLHYQIKICDRFLIVPDEAVGFLQMLRSEMITALGNDSTIQGAWGGIGVNSSGELFYMLQPPNVIRDPSFTRSEDIE